MTNYKTVIRYKTSVIFCRIFGIGIKQQNPFHVFLLQCRWQRQLLRLCYLCVDVAAAQQDYSVNWFIHGSRNVQ